MIQQMQPTTQLVITPTCTRCTREILTERALLDEGTLYCLRPGCAPKEAQLEGDLVPTEPITVG